MYTKRAIYMQKMYWHNYYYYDFIKTNVFENFYNFYNQFKKDSLDV